MAPPRTNPARGGKSKRAPQGVGVPTPPDVDCHIGPLRPQPPAELLVRGHSVALGMPAARRNVVANPFRTPRVGPRKKPPPAQALFARRMSLPQQGQSEPPDLLPPTFTFRSHAGCSFRARVHGVSRNNATPCRSLWPLRNDFSPDLPRPALTLLGSLRVGRSCASPRRAWLWSGPTRSPKRPHTRSKRPGNC